ncbi:MAG: ATP-binding protein, partial [Alteromonadales bacterium]|nr:ATP-binding protein [Alteromonadales bacterium]
MFLLVTKFGCPQLVFRLKGLQEHLQRVHGDGSYSRFLTQLSKCQILIIDDWGMESLTGQQR